MWSRLRAHLLLWLAAFSLLSGARPTRALPCVGDCDSNGTVAIDELVMGVNIALGHVQLERCPTFDGNDDDSLEISELIGGVVSSVEGCEAPTPTQSPTPTPLSEFVAQESDFECLTSWTRVRRFRITNTLGHLDDALAVADGKMPPPYPVGTIIQLVPQEAMVKRGNGFFPDGHDWEFFVLSPSSAGTTITKRGRGEVVNIGPACFASRCHAAPPQTDFICESANGCIPLNLPVELIDALQENDPRCPTPVPEP